MVNSSSYDDSSTQHQTQDRNAKAGFKQPYVSSENKHPSSPCNNGFSGTADSDLPSDAFAIEPTPTKTEFNSDMPNENDPDVIEKSENLPVVINDDLNESICCSVPLDKVQGVLTRFHQPKSDEETQKSKTSRKLLCLYCDRSFVSANLRQKHVERVHSVKQNRRVSSRRQNQHLTVTPCVYCDKLNSTEKTLKVLFHHLVNEHSNKYFGCLPCEERFLTISHLTDHNNLKHEQRIPETTPKLETSPTATSKTTLKSLPLEETIQKESPTVDEISVKVTRSKTKPKSEDPTVSKTEKVKKLVTKKKSVKLKELMNKKLSVKSSRITIKRRESKRLQAITKLAETQKRKRSKPSEKKSTVIKPKSEQSDSTNTTEKTTKLVPTCINPYPEFDSFYRVKKITDHSIDNLKISSLTFDDVFDKAFFNRIKCNIEENLLHHIDGKLFKNEESESRISNFEKISNSPQETQTSSSENYGCEISLNAVTPVAALSLNSQFGEDFESQIEYGSKPSKKKNQTKTDEVVHYKYFTRRKFQASILQHKENRDLSKLDMWTQLIIKRRQQKMLDDKKSAKEMQEYTDGDEYKNRIKREELNRILDRRGPFEDLKEEASKKVALDKLNSASEDSISHESFTEVREVLNEILNRVFQATECFENVVEEEVEKTVNVRIDVREIPGYLNLRRSSSLPSDEIDRSDKITLICSSQETENFELPTNQVRGKNEIVELSGEWARCRMYICAACGAKLPNIKYLLEHKSLYHQNVWVQHYEFVGNQSELYRHLSIPTLGKVGAVEESVPCKVWKRSDARICTKCGKQCNSLGELHRHILECGGDWTWMLARKKCKYRPFGAKSRRKRRGLIHRVHLKRKTEPTEKKKYKKTFEGPRQRPSDADSIQRMLANLPAKRSTRKLISLHDGIYRARKKTQIIAPLNKKNKVKCGKVIYKSNNIKETTEKTLNTTRLKLPSTAQKSTSSTNRRTLRSLNKVLASRIIDSNPKLTVKRKLRVINDKRRTRQCKVTTQEESEEATAEVIETLNTSDKKTSQKVNADEEFLQKRTSLRSQGKGLKKISMKQLLTGKINIKSFFPIKKRKNRKAVTDAETEQDPSTDDILTRSKSNNSDIAEVSKVDDDSYTNKEKIDDVNTGVKKEQKKIKKDTFGKLIRSFSLKKKNTSKLEECNASNKKNKSIQSINSSTNVKEKNTATKCNNDDNTSKKRKLKQNFRNVINRVKKLKIDGDGPSSSDIVPPVHSHMQDENKNSQKGAFLDKTKQNDKLDPCAPPEKIVIPSTLETKENLADISEAAPIVIKFNEKEDDTHFPERIFRLESNNEKSLQAKGELNFDTQPVTPITKQTECQPSRSEKDIPGIIQHIPDMEPISIETCIKPKIVPLISPNMKGKIRKPARGLNDCIAMLTSKLQQKVEELTDCKNQAVNKKESYVDPPHSPNIFRPFAEISAPKSDCILKIPNFKTHYTGMEETALDLSMKSQSNPELNRKYQHETFLQTRPPNFLFSIDYAKTLWMPSVPFSKQNSVDQTIEEVIEKGYRKQKEDENASKHQDRWNSVDEIIQNVIDGYKDTSDDTKTKATKIRNTVDDIIDFVVAGSTMSEETNKKHLDNVLGPEISEKKPPVNENHVDMKQDILVNTLSTEIEFGKKILCENYSQKKENEESLSKPLQEEHEKQSEPKKTKKRIRRKTDFKTNNEKSSVLIQEKTVQVPEEQSSKSEEIHDKVVPENNEKVDSEVTKINNETFPDGIDESIKLNMDQIDSKLPEIIDKSQEQSNLNHAFIHPPEDKIIGNKISTKKGRKIGQIRNNSLKKKAKGKILETDVDNILNFEEINKSNISVTNLGTVSTGAVQEPEIKLTTEDEPHLLENKVLSTKTKTAIPSDSEDEMPLSFLLKPDITINVDDHNAVETDSQIKEKDLTTESGKTIEEKISSVVETSPINPIENKVDDSDGNIEDMSIFEDRVPLVNTYQKIEKTLYKSKDEELNDLTELVVNNIERSEKVNETTAKTIPNGKRNRNRNREKMRKPKYTMNSDEFSQPTENLLTDKSDESITETTHSDTSCENQAIVDKDPISDSLEIMSTEVFKTPKKVRKVSRMQGPRKRSLGRKLKINELPKRSRSLGDLGATENSEADTDDESLLSIKMTLKLKQNFTESLCGTDKAVDEVVNKVAMHSSDDFNEKAKSFEKPVENETHEKMFVFPDQNKSDETISRTLGAQLDFNNITIEAEKDKHECLNSSQNESSLTFDKSDANNFFDSGISDESLENLEQRENITVPKRKSKKTKTSKIASKSNQLTIIKDTTDNCIKDDSVSIDRNSLIDLDGAIDKINLKETPNELITNRRSSRSRKRNSEVDLSDSSNSIFDISNDNTPDIQKKHDPVIIFSSPSPLMDKKQNITSNTAEQITKSDNLCDLKYMETVVDDLIQPPKKSLTDVPSIEMVSHTSDVVSIENNESDNVAQNCEIASQGSSLKRSNNKKVRKMKPKIRKKNCQLKLKKATLTTKQINITEDTSNAEELEVSPQPHANYEISLQQSSEEKIVSDLESVTKIMPVNNVERLELETGDNDLETNSSTNCETQIEGEVPSSTKSIIEPATKFTGRSKSLKNSRKVSDNIISKRSSSVSSIELPKPDSPCEGSDKSLDEEGISTRSVRKSRTTLRQVVKLKISENNKSSKSGNSNIETTSDMVDGELIGRRSRSARNKTINYAEPDISETTDSSTPQDGSPETSPEKKITEIDITSKIRLTSIARKLEDTNDILKMNKTDVAIEPLIADIKETLIKKKVAMVKKTETVFIQHRLRKRKFKRKPRVLKKAKKNKKINKPSEKRLLNNVIQKPSIPENLANLTKNEISLTASVDNLRDVDIVTNSIIDSHLKSADSDEKSAETNRNSIKSPTTNLPNLTICSPDIIKEPPIKIIINKQKTRRKSKSFRKIDIKGQNDLFRDFALVIKKPKRLAPIITFTPTDSILKETYPNLVNTVVEPVIGTLKPVDDKKASNENLDESVEEMDMELDEIPITSNIIERNAIPEMKDMNLSIEMKNVKNVAKKSKSRKVKSKRVRFTKKKDKIIVKAVAEIPQGDIEETRNNLETSETSTESRLESSSDNNILESTNIVGTSAVDKEIDFTKPENVSGNEIKECLVTVEAETVVNEKLETETNVDIEEMNELFTSTEVEPEKPVLRIKKTITKTKGKGKKIRKKLVINFSKRNGNLENDLDNSDLKVDSELLNEKSLNNNLLTSRESDSNQEVINESIMIPVDKKDSPLTNLESDQFCTQTVLVENEIDAGRKLRTFRLTKDSSPKSESCKFADNLQTNMDFFEYTGEPQEMEPPFDSTSTPIKLNLSIAIPNSSKEKDFESIYTFNESEDIEMDKPIEIPKRLPRKKNSSLSESLDSLQNNNLAGNLKEVSNTAESHISKKSNRKKAASLSESPALLKPIIDIKTIDKLETDLKTIDDIPSSINNTSKEESIELEETCEKEDSSKQEKTDLKNLSIKENNVEIEDNTRRQSMRSAKVKALEHIHDEALAELTESERNRKLGEPKIVSQEEIDVLTSGKKNVNKKAKKNQKLPKILPTLDFDNKILVDDKSPSFADLVADLAGLEELENSIERELNAADDNFGNNEPQNDLDFSSKGQIQENDRMNVSTEQDNQELRRSRRGSRKIASYNESDLIDPILDVVDRKKKNRKKDIGNILVDEFKCEKVKDEIKKLNSDELFDLLKSSENEKTLSSNPVNSFTNMVHRISMNHLVSDNTESVYDCISEDKNDKMTSEDPKKIYEFTESLENSEPISFPHIATRRKSNKNLNNTYSTDKPVSGDNTENSTSSASCQETISLDNSVVESKSTKAESTDSNFCEICNKSFIRTENLVKHKRTLTHIQKLSELEAKQAEVKSKLEKKSSEESSQLILEESPITLDSSLSDINIHNILLESEKPNENLSQIVHSSFPNNDSLKLADIISDVLNKPSLTVDNDDPNYKDAQNTNETQPELRRYKSLGERKIFDSDNILNIDHNSLPISESYISKTTILEKQISLLENIIENQTGVSYIDDISISSNNSALENSEFSSKQDDSNNPLSKDKNVSLNSMENSFLKPIHYEEISEDSVNIRNYEEQKLRKTLNRDEELFLECCSLLKSGSEVSSYSNQRSQKVINRLGVKQSDEPESMEDKNLVPEPDYGLENDYSDGNSRIPTPLGDSYDDDASDSNTISSNWDINKMEPVFDDNPNVTSNLNFQEVLNKAIQQDKVEILCNFRKSPEKDEVQNSKEDDTKDNTEVSPSKKKIITKGARKVFEGLKVSIPTEELNLEKVLNCSPKCKKIELQILQNTTDDQSLPETMHSPQKPSRNARKSKPVKKAQVGSNLLFKVKKKKTLMSSDSTPNTKQEKDSTKSIDVYDFEETQDNTDIFQKPDFRAFRSKKSNENLAEAESDTESRDDYLEPFIGQPESVTSSLSSSSSIRKSKAQESITKKKCMIMGRIFKNQAKSKIEDIDEEMRDIPIIDNDELVENYVANCKIIKNEMKPKLSETEINQLFDQLLEKKDNEKDDCDTLIKGASKLKQDNGKDKEKKVNDNKKKKIKSRKRARTNSESTDDEFNLSKSNKRVYRKNGKAEDNSINLEQELRECIGVASRKSQRKCTSGKQNVLVEYWSSDESQFEALLESQRIDHKYKQQAKTAEAKPAEPSESASAEKPAETKKSEAEFEKLPTILKPPPRPKPLRKSQSKRKHASEKDKTLNLNVTINSNKNSDLSSVNRRKRAAANPLYHWSSSSEDESQDLIEIKPLREDEEEFEDDRPVQHGWIVGESPKKLVTMLAQAKGKKLIDVDCVKEQGKKRTNNSNS